MAEITISGGEIAQLEDIVKVFDLVGMAVGRVDLDKVLPLVLARAFIVRKSVALSPRPPPVRQLVSVS